MKFSDCFEYISSLGEGKYGRVWLVKKKGDEIKDADSKNLTRESGSSNLTTESDSKNLYTLKMIPYSRHNELNRHEYRVLHHLSQNPHKYVHRFIERYDFEDDIGILMEYFDGISLYDLLETLTRRDKKIKPSRLLRFMKEILTGLSHLHKLGIAHRDIKDENILFNKDGVCIIDFTFSIMTEFDDYHKGLVGNYTFMAPEVWLADRYILTEEEWIKADIWSAGLVFWALCNPKEEPPSSDIIYPSIKSGINDTDFIRQKLKERAEKDLQELNPEITEIILLCIEPDVKKRLSATQLLEKINMIKLIEK